MIVSVGAYSSRSGTASADQSPVSMQQGSPMPQPNLSVVEEE